MHQVGWVACVAACASRQELDPVGPRMDTSRATITWHAVDADGSDEPRVALTFALADHAIAHDVLLGTMASDCKVGVDGPRQAFIACPDAMVHWDVVVDGHAVVITRVDSFYEPVRERRRDLVRIASPATSLVLVPGPAPVHRDPGEP